MLGLTDANITYNSMIYLVGLTSVKHLELHGCGTIANVRVRDLTSLTSLTVLRLGWSVSSTGESASYLGRLTALQDLDFRGCETMSDVGMMHLTLLTSLTRLNLNCCHGIADEGTMCLGSLTAFEGPWFGMLQQNHRHWFEALGIIDFADEVCARWPWQNNRQGCGMFDGLHELESAQFGLALGSVQQSFKQICWMRVEFKTWFSVPKINKSYQVQICTLWALDLVRVDCR